MTIASKIESSSVGPSVSGLGTHGLGPHIEELHAFFRTRGIGFGSVADLNPFLERLDVDASFRDEMASMVRTIIYRERDGLSWAELMELVAAAVGGPAVEDAAAPEVREAVRRLMVFVESVFRTRRNPGASSGAGAVHVAVPEPEPERKETERSEGAVVEAPVLAEAAEVTPTVHPTTDVFYRARMVAEEEAGEKVAEEQRAEEDVAHEETVLLHREQPWRVPLEDFEDRGTAERGSRAWLWVAGFCALLLAFCAGLFVHQRLIMPLRDANTPYEAPPPEAKQETSAPQTAPVAGTQSAADTISSSGATPIPSAVPVGDVGPRPRYMAPATIGAPPAVMASHLEYAPLPSYPMMAEMTRTQGRVTVEAVVGKDGRVIRARAIGGHRLLRGAAVREVYGRRYRPYTVNARPMDVATLVTVDFRLRR